MPDFRWWQLLPPGVRTLPADLVVIGAWIAATVAAVFLPVVRETPLRLLFGFPFVLFVPGYALVAALFPGGGELGATDGGGRAADGAEGASLGDDADRIDGLERAAFSFGTSVVLITLVGLALNFTPWGVRPVPVVFALAGVTLALAGVAARRRARLPEAERFSVPYRGWVGAAGRGLFRPDTYLDGALNALLVVALVLAVASVGYAVAGPGAGEEFTEFYLLHEDEDGELVATDYPTNFTAGEDRSLHLGVNNHEGEAVQYTVVVELQRVDVANDSTAVRSENELHRFRRRLPANETWRLDHSVAPRMVGDRLRLAYLLYRGEPPADPTVRNAYRENHLWINVSRSE